MKKKAYWQVSLLVGFVFLLFSGYVPVQFWIGTNKTNYQFTGYEQDNGTGLDYAGARYYDPAIGRFLGVDPLALLDPDYSPYHYVWNSPTNFIDPFGLTGEDPDGESSFWDQQKAAFNRDWDAIFGPENGAPPGWLSWNGTVRSYLENYRDPAGGQWEKQFHRVGNDDIYGNTYWGEWAYDWIWGGSYQVAGFFSNIASIGSSSGISLGWNRNIGIHLARDWNRTGTRVITGTPPDIGGPGPGPGRFGELRRLVKMWGKGTFRTRAANIRHHANKHGDGNILKYLRKSFNFNKKRARSRYRRETDSTIWKRKNGEFLIERNGKIVNYGKN